MVDDVGDLAAVRLEPVAQPQQGVLVGQVQRQVVELRRLRVRDAGRLGEAVELLVGVLEEGDRVARADLEEVVPERGVPSVVTRRASSTPCQKRTVASMSGVTSARWCTPRQCTVSWVAAMFGTLRPGRCTDNSPRTSAKMVCHGSPTPSAGRCRARHRVPAGHDGLYVDAGRATFGRSAIRAADSVGGTEPDTRPHGKPRGHSGCARRPRLPARPDDQALRRSWSPARPCARKQRGLRSQVRHLPQR